MPDLSTEVDSLVRIDAPADKLWVRKTGRSLQHFSNCEDLIPREMIGAYAIIKRGCLGQIARAREVL